MPALAQHGKEARVHQLGQVPGGRLRADAGMPGDLVRDQGTPAHQRQQDVGAGRVAGQGSGPRQGEQALAEARRLPGRGVRF